MKIAINLLNYYFYYCYYYLSLALLFTILLLIYYKKINLGLILQYFVIKSFNKNCIKFNKLQP